MGKIYIVTHGNLDDVDYFLSAHASHQGAINVCVDAARAMVDEMNVNPNEEWTSTSDLEKHTVVKREMVSGSRFPAYHMAWWDIEEVELQE